MATVKQLKAALAEFPDDYEVVLAKDSEGNGFSPLSSCGDYYYVPDSAYSGELYGRNDKLPANKAAQKVVGLWPTN